MTQRLDYDDALKIIQKEYHNLYNEIKKSLSKRAIVTLAECSKNGKTKKLLKSDINKLVSMNDESQARWIANPVVENLLQSYINGLLMNRQNQSTQKHTQDPTKSIEKPEPEDPEPDDGMDVFGLFD